MTSFQERFKGKTSTISKEGVIPSLDKPPISKGYIQKDLQYQQQDRQQGTSNYSQKSSNYAGSSRGNQSTSSNPSTHTPLSNPYIIPETKVSSHQAKGYSSQGVGINKQQQSSNSNFSTRSEQSNNSKVSISQKIQQPQQNDAYFVNNPFDLDLVSLQNVSGNGYQSKQGQQSYGKPGMSSQQQPYNLGGKGYKQNSQSGAQSQANRSFDLSNNVNNSIQNTPSMNINGNQNNSSNNVLKDNGLANLKTKNQSHKNKISAYTLENNSKSPQNQTGTSNLSQGTSQTPYHHFNPYTLDAIENATQQLPNKHKTSSSPDIKRYNRVLQQQQNNLQYQEEEASAYVQSYVPSFAQHVLGDNSKLQSQQIQQTANGTNLSNTKKSSVSDIPSNLQSKGNLGANTSGNEEWNQKKEKSEKTQEYSAFVKYMNQQQQSSLPPSNQRRPKQKEEEKKVSSRDKALEFSKNIPKPRAKTEKNVTQESSGLKQQTYNNQYNYQDESSPTSNANTNNGTDTIKSYNSNGYANQYESDIEGLERQHLAYLNKIEQLNIN